MAFIDKKNPVVLNIKLTSKGRELLSEGNLTFKYFAVGDSEMDYRFNNTADFNPFNSFILRPADKNPNLLSFITKDLTGDTHNAITNVPSTPTVIQNTTTPLGFFSISTGVTYFLTDTDHIKQPDVMISVTGVTGGTILELLKAPTYLANVNEPTVGDLILVKWTNRYGIDTTGYTVNKSYPTPYLVYKIHDIISGNLAGDNLIVEVDRNLPDMTVATGGTDVRAGALIYYDYENFTGNTVFDNFSTDYVSDSVIAFLQNCQCPTESFPFWNMSIIYTEEIAGVQNTDRSYTDYKSKSYAGFVSYIQNQAPLYNKLGVVHYTNSSPANAYGEEFFQNTPIMHLPTVMWHKSMGRELGLTLTALGSIKYLTGATKSLNTAYYDLADPAGNVVGKIFNDLKLFVIEDQELLFAMSYKANRSWTMPDYTVGINDNVVVGCLTSEIDFQLSGNTLSTFDATDGELFIYDIVNFVGGMILQVSGDTAGQIYLDFVTGNTLLVNLSGDTYTVRIFDTEAINTPTGKTINITVETALLSMYDTLTTANGLNPDFGITQTSSNATQIRIYKNDIGTIYGTGLTTPSVGIKGYYTSSITWRAFGTNDYIDLYFTYEAPYTIYVRDEIDYLGAPFEYIVSQNYVAVGSPFRSTFSVIAYEDDEETDTSLKYYVQISNYLTTIVDSTNRIVGPIEFIIYPNTIAYRNSLQPPPVWERLDAGAALGSVKRIYVDNTSDPIPYYAEVREVLETTDGMKIQVARVGRSFTLEF